MVSTSLPTVCCTMGKPAFYLEFERKLDLNAVSKVPNCEVDAAYACSDTVLHIVNPVPFDQQLCTRQQNSVIQSSQFIVSMKTFPPFLWMFDNVLYKKQNKLSVCTTPVLCVFS